MGEAVFRLFVSSPGDVPAERARAEAVVEKLNAEFKDRARFDAEFWEEHAYTADETYQEDPRGGRIRPRYRHLPRPARLAIAARV